MQSHNEHEEDTTDTKKYKRDVVIFVCIFFVAFVVLNLRAVQGHNEHEERHNGHEEIQKRRVIFVCIFFVAFVVLN